jgi:nucleoside-diphosphate-sugar epimerase
MAKILIIGCGGIGSMLADALLAQGHQVTGLKRNPPTSKSSRINYVTADISSVNDMKMLDNDFTQAFFIVSPDGRNEYSYRSVYETGLNNLLVRLPKANWFMVSSTSVYGQSQGEWVDEESVAEPNNITSQLIRQAEQTVMGFNEDNSVVRFSGIYGPGREYLLRLALQTPEIQQTPPYYTNRIHQQDCIGVLSFLLEQRLAGKALAQCYLASDDDPASMWKVMSWLANQLKCKPPMVRDGRSLGISGESIRPVFKPDARLASVDAEAIMNKRCDNARLKALGYVFQYPGYKDGYQELIGSQVN